MKEVLITFYNSESKDVPNSDFNFEVGYFSPSKNNAPSIVAITYVFQEEQSARDPSFLSS